MWNQKENQKNYFPDIFQISKMLQFQVQVYIVFFHFKKKTAVKIMTTQW